MRRNGKDREQGSALRVAQLLVRKRSSAAQQLPLKQIFEPNFTMQNISSPSRKILFELDQSFQKSKSTLRVLSVSTLHPTPHSSPRTQLRFKQKPSFSSTCVHTSAWLACQPPDQTTSVATVASTRCSTCRQMPQRTISGAPPPQRIQPGGCNTNLQGSVQAHSNGRSPRPSRDGPCPRYCHAKVRGDEARVRQPPLPHASSTAATSTLIFARQIMLLLQVRHPHGPHSAADIRRVRREGRGERLERWVAAQNAGRGSSGVLEAALCQPAAGAVRARVRACLCSWCFCHSTPPFIPCAFPMDEAADSCCRI